MSESARILRKIIKREHGIRNLPEKEKEKARENIQKMFNEYLRERRGWKI